MLTSTRKGVRGVLTYAKEGSAARRMRGKEPSGILSTQTVLQHYAVTFALLVKPCAWAALGTEEAGVASIKQLKLANVAPHLSPFEITVKLRC